jgi:hypothetical protein
VGKTGSIALPPHLIYKSDETTHAAFDHQRVINFIINSILADARRQANTNENAAIQRCLEAMQFSQLWCVQGFRMPERQIGMSGIQLACEILQPLLLHPSLSEKDIRQIGMTLYKIDQNFPDLHQVWDTEFRHAITEQENVKTDPNIKPSSSKDLRRVTERFLNARQSNSWGIDRFNPEFLKDKVTDDVLLLALASMWVVDEESIQYTLTQLRLTEGICALRLNQPTMLVSFPDPFTSEPLKYNETKVWSVGFDLEDQGGVQSYEKFPTYSKKTGLQLGDFVVQWK